jgi:Trk-type K+ transport system membrane component
MTSLSGQFKTISKVVVCAMMIRGRHRGLPYAVDRAVILPGDAENRDQENEAGDRLEGSGLDKGK